jgi:hypothetical protein
MITSLSLIFLGLAAKLDEPPSKRRPDSPRFSGTSDVWVDDSGTAHATICRRPQAICQIRGLDGQKLQIASLIAKKFEEAELPFLAAPAIATAFVESSLNPQATRGEYTGLFQLGYKTGLGMGMTFEECKNPEKNIDKIISKIKAIQAHAKNENKTDIFEESKDEPETLVRLLTYHVLAPRDKEVETQKRINAMYTLFPSLNQV